MVVMKESLMYARNVTLQLKANSAAAFTRTLETDVLPLLRKQNGFQDEIAFVAPTGASVLSISLWDRKDSADAYARNTYPTVLKTFEKIVEGTPTVDSYEVSSSTFHKIASRNNFASNSLGPSVRLTR